MLPRRKIHEHLAQLAVCVIRQLMCDAAPPGDARQIQRARGGRMAASVLSCRGRALGGCVEPTEAASSHTDVMTRFRLVSVLVWTSLLALTEACGAATEPSTAGSGGASEPESSTSTRTRAGGDAAVWSLGHDQSLQKSSRKFTALVSRLDCNNGVTGQVLAPEIHISESEVVVTFSVVTKQLDRADCPSNDKVSYEVDLGEPLRDRALIDGQCLPGGRAVTTSFCATGPTRSRP